MQKARVHSAEGGSRHTQESLAEALGVDRTTIGRWESGRATPQPWMRPKLAKALRTSLDQLAVLLSPPQGEPAVPAQSSGHAPAAGRPQGVRDTGLIVEAVAADSSESALFLHFASTSNVDSTLLEQLDADIVRLAKDYVSKPLTDVFQDISTLRRAVFDLLRGRQRPHQTAHLYLAAGRLCGLATHVALDLGQYAAAATHSRTAWRCAESAGDNGLRAWVRSVQSLIAYWQQNYRQAADLARSGLPYAIVGTIAARLLSLEARAAAAIGDTERALRAVEAAADARHAHSGESELPGVFTFPDAKQWAYAGTTLLAINSLPHLGRAIEASSRAITLYESAPEEDRSSGDLQAARLDLATAHLVNGDIDGVHDALTVVLGVTPDRRTASISKRLHALSARLAEPVYARSPMVMGLRETVREACTRPSLTNPTESAT
ncbi:helix-turn-helix transcriptional regulator [Streptomyces sp. NPDC097640]|uniref:helix-turn-helix transcriptional regulator n=1 Tax=Streptomyces sp. NPDC097640 TaxID=3157229 RepID=UPI00332A199D